jgi:hypothetical protein
VRQHGHYHPLLCLSPNPRGKLLILSKLKFEQIDANNQCTLLFTMIEMIAAEECKSIQDFAEAKGQTPFEVWSKFCAGAGLDECEPWNGYPSQLSEETIKHSPGATPELTRECLRWWAEYEIRGSKKPARGLSWFPRARSS